ncbi:MAG TPA: hypothetical protein VFF37_01970, partial [Streptomyces sp.]|nr:hypothetical protein [Streptomyces sp.]
MHKNIRRSIAVAATATGMWALGTAAASADEVAVSVPLSTPDQAADAVEDVKDVASDVRGEAVDAAAQAKGAAHDPQNTAKGAVPAAKGAAQGATAHVDALDTRGTADQARQYAEAELPAYDLPAAPDVADVQGEIDYLFGPLSAFAADLEQAP